MGLLALSKAYFCAIAEFMSLIIHVKGATVQSFFV